MRRRRGGTPLMSIGKKEVRVYDDAKRFVGLPVIHTTIDREDVRIVYYSEANNGTFSIPLKSLIEVYEERMG